MNKYFFEVIQYEQRTIAVYLAITAPDAATALALAEESNDASIGEIVVDSDFQDGEIVQISEDEVPRSLRPSAD